MLKDDPNETDQLNENIVEKHDRFNVKRPSNQNKFIAICLMHKYKWL